MFNFGRNYCPDMNSQVPTQAGQLQSAIKFNFELTFTVEIVRKHQFIN